MSKVKLHEDCKVLSEAVYQKEKPKKINGWEYVDKYYNDQTGFYSEVYKKGDTVIFSIRGTEIKSGIKEAKKDIKNDKELDFNQEIDNDTMQSYIKQYLEKPEMPTKTELNKRVHIGNLIYIEEYTRSDGTKVSGYYRAYPQK